MYSVDMINAYKPYPRYSLIPPYFFQRALRLKAGPAGSFPAEPYPLLPADDREYGIKKRGGPYARSFGNI
ncbi:MAG TPA: hypothetical protein DCW47_09820 [Lachnospiraceae bacterium]|nr:hypothetical protein [Lachnospiraceae bacterium]